MAAELMEILSAPSRKITLKSSTVRMPPPTVKGINSLLATSLTHLSWVFLASEEAVMSKKTTSSAPKAS